MPTIDEALTALINNGGAFAAAAEQFDMSVDAFMGCLATTPDMPTITQRLRNLLQLKMFNILMQVSDIIPVDLAEIEPAQLIKLYTSLLTNFDSFTAPQPDVTLTTTDLVFRTRQLAEQSGVDPDAAIAALKQSLPLTAPRALTNGTNGHSHDN
jgi:hypothetical protein